MFWAQNLPRVEVAAFDQFYKSSVNSCRINLFSLVVTPIQRFELWFVVSAESDRGQLGSNDRQLIRASLTEGTRTLLVC
jgi:hypothetical protein